MSGTAAELIKERDAIGQRLKDLEKEYNTCNKIGWNEAVLQMKHEALDENWSNFRAKRLEVSKVVESGSEEEERNEKEAFEMAYVYLRVKEGLEKMNTPIVPLKDIKPSEIGEIKLPKFSGNYKNWSSWREEYLSKVYNTTMEPKKKIELLLSHLVGEAHSCVGRVEQWEQIELERIWTRLEQRYENPYQIVCAHFKSLLDIPQQERADFRQLRRIIDTVNQDLKAVSRFKCGSEGWDTLLAISIIQKLDSSTCQAWMMERNNPKAIPSIRELFEFLEKRILELQKKDEEGSMGQCQNSEPKRLQQKPNDNNKRFASTQLSRPNVKVQKQSKPMNSELNQCSYCSSNHKILSCTSFADLTFRQRSEKVKKLNLCRCCLKTGHIAATCSWRPCNLCNQAKHCRLLCPKKIQ